MRNPDAEYVPTKEEVRTAWMNDGPHGSSVVRALQFERWYDSEFSRPIEEAGA